MPGHKGAFSQNVNDSSLFAAYKFDITEIFGADSLYEADGIIRESERISSELFGADTFYSTEGSSLSIRAMLALVAMYAGERGERPRILAARNVHKSFVTAAALLDIETEWLYSEEQSYLSCRIDAKRLDAALSSSRECPTAVYLTSPDYLGIVQDIGAISEVCHRHGVLLLVDNAHGAYLKFLNPSRHPIDLGADMCADSAHKTLSVLTGGAYLHLSRRLPPFFKQNAKSCMAMFGSTSPSYLILASLDLFPSNIPDYLSFAERVAECKREIEAAGYTVVGDEPIKITLKTKEYGYLGTEISELLCERGIICEFSDPDFLVLMASPMNTGADLDSLVTALKSIPRREPISTSPPLLTEPIRVLSPRAAALAPSVALDVKDAVGRALAAITVGCPPAVPILVSGELVTEEARAVFEYYNIKKISVVK